MVNKYQIFNNVLARGESRVDIAAKYLIDADFTTDDYTLEYAVTELIYDCCLIKRATRSTGNKYKEIEKLFFNAKNIVGHFGEKLWPRLLELHNNYFSAKEIRRLQLQIEKILEENDLEDDDSLSLFFDLFERKDKVNIFSNDESFFVDCLKESKVIKYDTVLQNYKHLSESFDEEFIFIWGKSDGMRNYTEGIQKSIRQMNLIPNTQEYKWWYTIKHINSENIQKALNQSLGKENVVALLNKVIPQQQELMDCRNSANNTIEYIIRKRPKAFTHLLNLTDSPTPAFKSWSESIPDTPTLSDHEINEGVLPQVPGLNREIIIDLINLAEDDTNLTEEERRNILVSAYFFIGDLKKALSLLGND